MADETFNVADQNIEYHIMNLLERLEAMRREGCSSPSQNGRLPAQAEVRTLDFWRAVISECMCSFLYVFVVCGAAAGAGVGASTSSVLLASALASGFVIITLTQCFGHISGAHVNPAVTVAMAITRLVTPLRAAAFVAAQCGGGIAGAALLYGVTVPGYHSNLQSVITQSVTLAAWERFGIEFLLSFVVVFAYFASIDRCGRWTGSAALTVGAAYAACTFVSMPYLNPARSLGPAFVLNKWDSHWVYWFGPLVGGMSAGLVYEFAYNSSRRRDRDRTTDGDSSSAHSDEDTYDDLDKPQPHQGKYHTGAAAYSTYRPAGTVGGPPLAAVAGYCPSLTASSLYTTAPAKLDRVESLYGGTKSLYCRSPPLTRANLNRSQSVYAKSNSALNHDLGPRPGPLVPAQSLYPMRITHQTIAQNQNAQNQIQARTDVTYGTRPGPTGSSQRPENQMNFTGQTNQQTQAIYGTRQNPTGSPNTENTKFERSDETTKYSRRPESAYGMVASQPRRGQSTQSDDSSYGSYHGPNAVPRGPTYPQGSCMQNGGYRHGIRHAQPSPTPQQY